MGVFRTCWEAHKTKRTPPNSDDKEQYRVSAVPLTPAELAGVGVCCATQCSKFTVHIASPEGEQMQNLNLRFSWAWINFAASQGKPSVGQELTPLPCLPYSGHLLATAHKQEPPCDILSGSHRKVLLASAILQKRDWATNWFPRLLRSSLQQCSAITFLCKPRSFFLPGLA